MRLFSPAKAMADGCWQLWVSLVAGDSDNIALNVWLARQE
jgi:hypothetical protein